MKYRKKPVIIDAARYMIDKSLPDWFMDRVTDNTITIHEDGTCHIRTLEGIMKADRGDYIILGVNGEVYPCKPDIFEKTYDKVIEVEFCPGITIKEAVEELKERAKDGNAYCGRFNVWAFTSDMSVDDAYMMAMGKTYSQHQKEQEEWREEYDRRKEEHKAKIPELTKEWIKEGHKVLSEDKWQMWDECVPIRLSDLYEGMELGQCLDIIRTIKEKSIADGIEVMRNQGHSGMSWGLMKSMIKAFCDCGNEFLLQLGD